MDSYLNSYPLNEYLVTRLKIIRDHCLSLNLSIAVAESVTSGYVQGMLSAAPEAGLFFKGGLTTYSCGAKNRLLNIPEQQCKLVSGVSPDIAGMMAENVRKVYDSEIGMGITGFAALVPELGIVTKYAFTSVVLNDRVQHRFNFMSTKATQAEVQIDFAAQLVLACADCLHDARIEIR